jgi:hypothetical protein
MLVPGPLPPLATALPGAAAPPTGLDTGFAAVLVDLAASAKTAGPEQCVADGPPKAADESEQALESCEETAEAGQAEWMILVPVLPQAPSLQSPDPLPVQPRQDLSALGGDGSETVPSSVGPRPPLRDLSQADLAYVDKSSQVPPAGSVPAVVPTAQNASAPDTLLAGGPPVVGPALSEPVPPPAPTPVPDPARIPLRTSADGALMAGTPEPPAVFAVEQSAEPPVEQARRSPLPDGALDAGQTPRRLTPEMGVQHVAVSARPPAAKATEPPDSLPKAAEPTQGSSGSSGRTDTPAAEALPKPAQPDQALRDPHRVLPKGAPPPGRDAGEGAVTGDLDLPVPQGSSDLPAFLSQPHASAPTVPAGSGPPPRRSALAQAVLDRVTPLRNVAHETLVRLNPRGLGMIEVVVNEAANGGLDVTLRVQNPLVLEALRQDRDAVAQALCPAQGGAGGSLSLDLFQSNTGRQDGDTGQTPAPITEATEAPEPSGPTADPAAMAILHADHVNIVT